MKNALICRARPEIEYQRDRGAGLYAYCCETGLQLRTECLARMDLDYLEISIIKIPRRHIVYMSIAFRVSAIVMGCSLCMPSEAQNIHKCSCENQPLQCWCNPAPMWKGCIQTLPSSELVDNLSSKNQGEFNSALRETIAGLQPGHTSRAAHAPKRRPFPRQRQFDSAAQQLPSCAVPKSSHSRADKGCTTYSRIAERFPGRLQCHFLAGGRRH